MSLAAQSNMNWQSKLQIALETHTCGTELKIIGIVWPCRVTRIQSTDSDSRNPYHTRRAILPPLLRSSISSGELQLLTFPLATPFGQMGTMSKGMTISQSRRG